MWTKLDEGGTNGPWMRMAMRSSLRWIVLAVLLTSSDGKTTSGDFQLTGEKSEHVLTKFSVNAESSAIMTAVITTEKPYPMAQHLHFRLYRDTEWPQFLKATTCRERAKLARMTAEMSEFELEDEARVKKRGKRNAKPMYRSEVHAVLQVDEKTKSVRPHYWYMVMDDCSLEEFYQDNRIPKLHFMMQIYNSFKGKTMSHLSSDELPLTRLHIVTMLLSSLLASIICFKVFVHLRSTGVVHVAKFFVMGAAWLDAMSSAFELLHVVKYRLDGIGFYVFDAISAYLECLCDAVICFLLLAIGAGWTLPNDVVKAQYDAASTAGSSISVVQSVMMALSNNNKTSYFASIFIMIGVVHFFLAQWGRTYNDDFDSYHDFEHLPGKILMVFRILLGVLMVVATVKTRQTCTVEALKSFYTKFLLVGFFWFQALPFMTWICNHFVPYYMRHPTIILVAAFLQSVSLLLLTGIVAFDGQLTAYHKVTRMARTTDENNFGESLAGKPITARNLNLFGRAKIRLD